MGLAWLGGVAAVALAIIVGVQMRRIAVLEGQVAEAREKAEARPAARTSSTADSEESRNTRGTSNSLSPPGTSREAASTIATGNGELAAENTDWSEWLAEGFASLSRYERAPEPTLRADLAAILDRYTRLPASTVAPTEVHRMALRVALAVRPEAMDRPVLACIQSEETFDRELLRRVIRAYGQRPTVTTEVLAKLEARWSRMAVAPEELLLEAAALWRLNRRAEAYDALDRAVVELRATGDHGSAVILAFHPGQMEYAFALRGLAAMLSSEGQLRESIKTWRDVLAEAPDDARAWDQLGCVLSDALECADAEAAFRKALELDVALPSARLHLGMALMNGERVAQAMDEFDALIIRGELSGPARFAKAVCLAQSGRLKAAEDELKRSLAMDPSLARQAAEVPAFKPLLEDER